MNTQEESVTIVYATGKRIIGLLHRDIHTGQTIMLKCEPMNEQEIADVINEGRSHE